MSHTSVPFFLDIHASFIYEQMNTTHSDIKVNSLHQHPKLSLCMQ